jgi:hypothetical protein
VVTGVSEIRRRLAGFGGQQLGSCRPPEKIGEEYRHAVEIGPQGKRVSLYGRTDHMKDRIGDKDQGKETDDEKAALGTGAVGRREPDSEGTQAGQDDHRPMNQEHE